MLTRNSLAFLFLTSACCAASAAQLRIEYRVTRVAPLISDGQAINNAGATVGSYQFSGFGAHAFLSRRDTAVDLGAFDDFGNISAAADINDRFQVVGTSATNTGERGFLYERGVMRDVNVFLPANTTATGINAAGYVVGAYQYNEATPPRGYLRAPGGSFRDIGTLPFANAYTRPEAINRRGQVVGASGPYTPGAPTVAYAFLYEGGRMRALGSLGGGTGHAFDINDHSQVTGEAALTAPGASHAFLWKDGRMVDIDGRKGVGQSTGYGVNNRGHVVGSSDHLGPFVYRGRKMESLNALIDPAGRYIIRDVQGINDKGQIVGWPDQEGVPFGFAVRLDPCHGTAGASDGQEAPAASE